MRYLFDVFELDTESGALLREGAPVPLRRQTFRLLQLLVERAPALLDRDTLLDEVWGHQALSPNVLPQAISELRQALGDSAQAPRLIETRHRRGYRFRAEVRCCARQPDADADPAPPDALRADRAEPAHAPSSPARAVAHAAEAASIRQPARWQLLAAVLAMLTVALWMLWTRAEAPAPLAAGPVVLALGPLIPGPDLPAWVAPAGRELLGAALARQPRLQLLRSDVLAPGEGSGDPRWQARAHTLLGAPLAAGGAWRARADGRIGIELSLIDLTNGRVLLAHRDSAPPEDLDRLAERAAAELMRMLQLPQLARPADPRPDAPIRLRYWQALEALTRGEPERAATELEALRALTERSEWLLPSLARAYRESGRRQQAAGLLLERLDQAASMPLGERLRVQAELGFLQHRPEAAAAALRALLELFPEDIEVQLQLAEAQLDALQGEAARATLRLLGEQRRAQSDPRYLLLQARAARLDGRYSEAHDMGQQALDAALDHRLPELAAAAVLSRAETFKREGDLAAADALLEHFSHQSGDALPALPLGQLRLQRLALLREQGRHRAALEQIDQLSSEALPEALAPRLGIEAALLHALGGRADQAADWLQRVAPAADAIDDPDLAIGWGNADGLRAVAAGDIDAAAAAFDAAFAKARRSGRAGQHVALQVNAGLMLARQRRFEEAEAQWMQALTVFEQLGDRRGQATCLGNLAAAASASGRGERAEELNRQALELFRELSLAGPLARTAYNLGLGARRRGDLSAAAALFAESLEGWLREGQADAAVQAAVQRAELFLIAGDSAAAERQLQAVQAQRASAGPLSRSHWLAASAQRALATGRLESARQLEAEALALRVEAGHAGWVALGELNLLRIDLLQGADPLALQIDIEALIGRFERLGDGRDLARARLLQAEAMLVRGSLDEASRVLEGARAAARDFADLELAMQIDWVNAWVVTGEARQLRLQALQQRAESGGFAMLAGQAARSLALAEADGDRPTGGEDRPDRPPLPPYARWRDAPAASDPEARRISP